MLSIFSHGKSSVTRVCGFHVAFFLLRVDKPQTHHVVRASLRSTECLGFLFLFAPLLPSHTRVSQITTRASPTQCIDENYAVELLKKYKDWIYDWKHCIGAYAKMSQCTLFKYCIYQGHVKFLKRMFDYGLAPEVSDDHLSIAKQNGRFKAYELLMSKKVGDAALKTVEDAKERISRSEAVASAFEDTVSSVLGKKANDFLNRFSDVLCNLIKDKRPVSEDMLVITWRDPKRKNSLWNSLQKSSAGVLRLPVDKKQFVWFGRYVLPSGVSLIYSFSFSFPPTKVEPIHPPSVFCRLLLK